MRLTSLLGTCALSILSTAIAVSGCGSDDGKKKSPGDYSPGGEGGSAAGGDAGGSGGSSNAEAGQPTISGGAGADGGGAPSVGGAASDGGVPSVGDAAGAAGDGGAAGGGAVTPFNGLYIGEGGDDAGDGTVESPFATLSHAASVAQAGDTIVFLDGQYNVGAGVPVTIPAGVDVVADNPGQAQLSGGNQRLMLLTGDTRIEGLRFASYSRVIEFAGAAAASGTVTVIDSTFTNCAVALTLTGSAEAVVSTDAQAQLANGGNAFATLANQASLSVSGGVLQNYAAGGVFRAANESSITLTGVSVIDGLGTAVTVIDQASASLDGVKFTTLSPVVVQQRNSGELVIVDSELSIKPGAAVSYYCIAMEGNGTGSIEVTDSTLHGCGTAVRGPIPAELTLTGVEMYGLSFGGFDLDMGSTGVGGVVRLTDSYIHDFTYTAMRVGGGSTPVDLKVRGTRFVGGADQLWNLVIVNGGTTSTVDFGTLAEPGGNTFTTPNVARVALQLNTQAPAVSAVGNTWNADQQGADAEGKYAAPPGAGNTLLITGTSAAGRNYSRNPGTSLLLAQNP